jgi:hypothetical protein
VPPLVGVATLSAGASSSDELWTTTIITTRIVATKQRVLWSPKNDDLELRVVSSSATTLL